MTNPEHQTIHYPPEEELAEAAQNYTDCLAAVDSLRDQAILDDTPEMQQAKVQQALARNALLDAILRLSNTQEHTLLATQQLLEHYGFEVQMESEDVYQELIAQYAIGQAVECRVIGQKSYNRGVIASKPRLILDIMRPNDSTATPMMLLDIAGVDETAKVPFRTTPDGQITLSERIRPIN